MTERARELRLALGMRGGVSLAVWIGGACDEINRLCHAVESTDPNDFWKRRLDESGYGAVAIDVLAGASAGGLNAVLMAAAQHYGFEFERIRQLWLDLGSIDRLRRRGNAKGVPSLLDGDGAFLEPLQRELLDLIDDANRDGSRQHTRPNIDVRLSATHVEPLARKSVSPRDERLDLVRSGAWFHLRHTEGCEWLPSDFPPYEPPDGDARRRRALVAATWRLAVAARATSSFPVAFEAAVVRSARPTDFTRRREDCEGPLVDMFGVFSDSRGVTGRHADLTADDFVVLDGGWLDNIPLKRALDAIAVVPADRPTDRYLLYLQPGVPQSEGPTGAPISTNRRSTLNVGQGMFKAIWTSETIAQDIDALEEHNQAVARGAGLRATVFKPLEDGESIMALAARAWPSYRTIRASHDAARLRQLLDDPVGYLGEDPFPQAGEWSGRSSAPLAAWNAQPREALDAALGLTFLGGSTEVIAADAINAGDVLTNGLGPLMRVTRLLLEWALHLEAAGVAEATTQKQVLYRSLLLIEQILNRNRRLSWVVSAASSTLDEPTQLQGWIDGAAERANRLLRHRNDTVDKVVFDLKNGGNTGITSFVDRCSALLDGAVSDPDESVDIRTALHNQVLSLVMDEMIPHIPSTPADDPGALLDRAIRSTSEPSPKRIAALEIVCMPEFLAGVPGERPIRFVRMSAANPTPLATEFDALRRYADAHGIPWPNNDKVPVEVKLAGNDLFNFAAFFDQTWRANDWMWGRLDAVPTLVDLLTPVAMSAEEKTELVAKRQRQILAEELVKQPWPTDKPKQGEQTVLTSDALKRLIANHDTGTQTLTNPRRWEHADVLHQLSTVAGDAILWNAATLNRPAGKTVFVRRATWWAAHAITYGGRIASTTILAPRETTTRGGRLRFLRAALRAITARRPSR